MVLGVRVRLNSIAKPKAASRLVPVPIALRIFSGIALATPATASAPISKLKNTVRNIKAQERPKINQNVWVTRRVVLRSG